MPASICTLSSLVMVAGLLSLEDSKHWAAGVIDAGMMDVVIKRSGSAKKQSIWSHCCWKVL